MTTRLNISGNRRGLYEHRNQKPDRPYCFAAKSVWKANVRRAGDRKTYVGSYPTQKDAIAAANHFIATGQKPDKGMFGGSTKRGPKGRRDGMPAKQRKNPKPELQDTKPTAPKMSHQDKIAMLRGMLARIG